jgi:1-acyl-sn-glycerol-3-phosphate acyltransferase
MKFLKLLYTIYGFTIFILLFLFLLPLLFIPIVFPNLHKITGIVNRWWAKALFTFVFLPYKVELRSSFDSTKQYVFCPNHTSYMDIPAMGLTPVNTIFVGKIEIASVPLFGFMYSKLHITVNRKNMKSKGNAVKLSLDALAEGKSLVIFPEGGIYSDYPPYMTPFKDGAFRTAIEKQVPLVPVTMPNNWLILPDKKEMLLVRDEIKVIFHEPIDTVGLTLSDVDALKQKVFTIIDNELKLHGYNTRNTG